MVTLLWMPEGPLIKYADGTLYIGDLNPQYDTRWRISRWEMFKTGLNFILAAAAGEAAE